jgi:hypothetical protein
MNKSHCDGRMIELLCGATILLMVGTANSYVCAHHGRPLR